MAFTILGLGTAVPSTVIDQKQGAGIAKILCCRSPEHETWLPAMYDKTGIDKRHLSFPRQLIVDLLEGTRHSQSVFLPKDVEDDPGPTTGQRMREYAREAPPLAIRAAGRALEQASIAPDEITHLVTVSCTGFGAPGVDFEVVKGLGLRPTAERTNVGYMGCHGALNGLRVARGLASSDPNARVLLCAVELCGLHYHYGWDPQKIVANAIFADGAAAIVGAFSATANPSEWRLVDNGSCLIPDSHAAMTWTIGDHGFEMTLSKKVPELIVRNLKPWMEAWLARNNLRLDEVNSWAIHPGGPKIVEAAEEALGLPREASVESRAVFAAHGNMSSPTVLFILDRLRQKNAPRPCVAVGFGPGLTAEAALFS